MHSFSLNFLIWAAFVITAATGSTLLSSRELLSLVRSTNYGASASSEVQAAASAFIRQNRFSTSPLEDPKLLGNYEVSYVSSGGNQKGNPAGGNFRGKIGQKIYQTLGLYQHILEPCSQSGESSEPRVINFIEGRLFGFLSLFVVLVGRASAIGAAELAGINLGVPQGAPMLSLGGAVRASFEPPLLALSLPRTKTLLTFQVGPVSSVVLGTQYVDEALRTGVGARGSLFLFRRLVSREELEKSDAWKRVVASAGSRPLRGKSVAKIGLTLAVLWAAQRLKRASAAAMSSSTGLRRLWAAVRTSPMLLWREMILVVSALALIRWKGGIVDETPPESRPLV